jgi:hypothetical protein
VRREGEEREIGEGALWFVWREGREEGRERKREGEGGRGRGREREREGREREGEEGQACIRKGRSMERARREGEEGERASVQGGRSLERIRQEGRRRGEMITFTLLKGISIFDYGLPRRVIHRSVCVP